VSSPGRRLGREITRLWAAGPPVTRGNEENAAGQHCDEPAHGQCRLLRCGLVNPEGRTTACFHCHDEHAVGITLSSREVEARAHQCLWASHYAWLPLR